MNDRHNEEAAQIIYRDYSAHGEQRNPLFRSNVFTLNLVISEKGRSQNESNLSLPKYDGDNTEKIGGVWEKLRVFPHLFLAGFNDLLSTEYLVP